MEIPVYREGRPAGVLRLWRDGERTGAEMDCDMDPSGLFRGFLQCGRGEVPLGVLEPKNGRLALRRRLLTAELDRLGQPVAGEMRLSFPFQKAPHWQKVSRGEPFFRNAALQRELERTEGALECRERGCRCLAIPFRAGGAFPLAALFCFARVEQIDGGAYAVFRFDSQGRPLMPEGQPGETTSPPAAY